MTAVELKPIILNDVTLKLGDSAGSNYEGSVSSVEFAPSSSIVTWKGLTPAAAYSFGTSPSWVCNLAYAQDWETTDSLSGYLFDNQGKTVTAEFTPKAGGTGFTAEVIIVPGSIGGAVDAVAVATVSLGVQGAPSRIVAA